MPATFHERVYVGPLFCMSIASGSGRSCCISVDILQGVPLVLGRITCSGICHVCSSARLFSNLGEYLQSPQTVGFWREYAAKLNGSHGMGGASFGCNMSKTGTNDVGAVYQEMKMWHTWN